MLSNNNMLTVGGAPRQRERRSVYVNKPSYGFFIAGSSIEGMNGVYVRRNPPRVKKDEDSPAIALYYEHEEGVWHMQLRELPEDLEDEDDEDDFYYYRQKKKPTHEWMFTDGFGKDRFTHEGDTIVPGAGVRWKHVHEKNPAATAADSPESDDDDDDDKSNESGAKGPAHASNVVAEIKPDDEDELPWQVIAILDLETLQDLLWSSEYRKQKVRDAKAGKNAPKTARASLEASFAPGKWLFRVACKEGVTLRLAADDESDEVGHCAAGEYVRGVELSLGGEWLRLDSSEDVYRTLDHLHLADDEGYGFYNADYSRRQVWARVWDSNKGPREVQSPLLEEVAPEDTAVLDLKGVGDSEGAGGTNDDDDAVGKSGGESMPRQQRLADEPAGGDGLTGDMFDKPFMPRMEAEGGSAQGPSAEDESLICALRAGVEPPEDPALLQAEARRDAAEAAATLRDTGVPVGASVQVQGLRSRSGMQYNGVRGVVITPLEAGTGRQGVRLVAPFSGKQLACKPETLLYSKEQESDDSSLGRAARVLGLPLSQMGLSRPSASSADACEADDGTDQKAVGLPAPQGWGFAGSEPAHKLGSAVRAALRDSGAVPAARNAARDAAEVLLAALHDSPTAAAADRATEGQQQSGALGRSPHLMLRSGALGSRAAAAAVSALSPHNREEREAGLSALRQLLRDETARSQSSRESVLMTGVGEDSLGVDELLLRLTLVQALLEDRREAEALQEIKIAAKFEEAEVFGTGGSCPAVSLLLGLTLLRLGMRADGLTALEVAESLASASAAAASASASSSVELTPAADCLRPLWDWGGSEAQRLLVVHRAAERCRTSAVEAYSRGAFQDASLLYGRALALLQTGLSEDKRGRATALADRAGCLRRARQLDAAVADLDAALRLFPRYARALFRRAACLLEAGKAEAAVEGFKDLYRVDRDWPNLSEWLVRAFSLKKRQAKGYHTTNEDTQYEDPTTSSSSPNGGGGGGGSGSGKRGDTSSMPDIEVIAKEVDHYAVLGVSTDATEKQLKTAYRMRSLQFHPDRREGATAAFQRIAEAYEVLSDEDKRRDYDEGVDIKVKRGHRDDEDDEDDSEEEEEHKTTMREEVEREFYPERYSFWPFGDPFIYKRKREAQKRAKQGRPAWHEDHWD